MEHSDALSGMINFASDGGQHLTFTPDHLPAVDLRLRFGLPAMASTHFTVIVVVRCRLLSTARGRTLSRRQSSAVR